MDLTSGFDDAFNDIEKNPQLELIADDTDEQDLVSGRCEIKEVCWSILSAAGVWLTQRLLAMKSALASKAKFQKKRR